MISKPCQRKTRKILLNSDSCPTLPIQIEKYLLSFTMLNSRDYLREITLIYNHIMSSEYIK